MTRNVRGRGEQIASEFLPTIGGWGHQCAPLLAVLAEFSLRVGKAALQNYSTAIIEGMRQRRLAMNPFQSVVAQRKGGQER